MDTYSPRKGDRVRLVADLPDQLPPATEFTIKAVNDEAKHPGKLVALETDEPWPMLHNCDGNCGEKRGWWSRPEHLVKVS